MIHAQHGREAHKTPAVRIAFLVVAWWAVAGTLVGLVAWAWLGVGSPPWAGAWSSAGRVLCPIATGAFAIGCLAVILGANWGLHVARSAAVWQLALLAERWDTARWIIQNRFFAEGDAFRMGPNHVLLIGLLIAASVYLVVAAVTASLLIASSGPGALSPHFSPGFAFLRWAQALLSDGKWFVSNKRIRQEGLDDDRV